MEPVWDPGATTAAFDLGTDDAAPRRARAQLDARAAGLLPPDRFYDARLVLTELVSNAVMHGTGEVRLVVESTPEKLRVEVIDDGRLLRTPCRNPDREGGWGLTIVDALADRWGVFAGSTHVWFEIERPGGGHLTEPASRPCAK